MVKKSELIPHGWAFRDNKGYYVCGANNKDDAGNCILYDQYGPGPFKFPTIVEAAEAFELIPKAHRPNLSLVQHHPPARARPMKV